MTPANVYHILKIQGRFAAQPIPFVNLSKGIVSNVMGSNNDMILTDARCVPGCEGCPVFMEPVHSKLNRSLYGIVVAPFSWRSATTYPFCPFSCSQSSSMATRRAKHAGSWYSSNVRDLNSQLQGWLTNVNTVFRPARAIIAPHAGYIYCGPCGAHAYKQVDPSRVKRVFILGPSHHVHLTGCDLTGCSYYSTPFYDLEVDKAVNDELLKTGDFDMMSKSTDENEHSIELHLPYIAKVMESKRGQFTIVPVLVGSLTPEKERKYGEIFSKYFMNPENLFIISSDFCHWGEYNTLCKRFRYHYQDSRYHHIHESIEALDRKGMDHIERLDAGGFSDYIEKYANTICGRYPIGVFLSPQVGTTQFDPNSGAVRETSGVGD
ncbi:hypothetical protein QZH41_012575, partial [Actinostola sp. cb2023]